MPIKGLQLLPFVALVIFAGAGAFAQEQRRSMLGDFDLKSVILSPTPLGPPSRFAPPPAAEKRAAEKPAAEKRVTEEPAAEKRAAEKPVAEKPAAAPTVAESKAAPPPRKQVRRTVRQKPAVAARKPKRDPLESYARDTRPQIWPCVGDGICIWKQPPLLF